MSSWLFYFLFSIRLDFILNEVLRKQKLFKGLGEVKEEVLKLRERVMWLMAVVGLAAYLADLIIALIQVCFAAMLKAYE